MIVSGAFRGLGRSATFAGVWTFAVPSMPLGYDGTAGSRWRGPFFAGFLAPTLRVF
jgi:hypothetical protein